MRRRANLRRRARREWKSIHEDDSSMFRRPPHSRIEGGRRHENEEGHLGDLALSPVANPRCHLSSHIHCSPDGTNEPHGCGSFGAKQKAAAQWRESLCQAWCLWRFVEGNTIDVLLIGRIETAYDLRWALEDRVCLSPSFHAASPASATTQHPGWRCWQPVCGPDEGLDGQQDMANGGPFEPCVSVDPGSILASVLQAGCNLLSVQHDSESEEKKAQ